MLRHQSFLEFCHYRYLKIAVLLMIAAIGAYFFHQPIGKPYGGTWLGYLLGTIGALIIVWLLWFGVRKRSYRSTLGTVQGWLSAHVYLGAALLVIVTLHTGFELGWNIHTLAYVLMLLVIASGSYGVYAYLRYPRLMTKNIGDESPDSLLLKIADIDRQCRELAMNLPDAINREVLNASQTVIGGGVLRQLSGKDQACPTAAAIEKLSDLGRKLQGSEARTFHELYAQLLKKQEYLQQARYDVRFRALLNLWLYCHVPLSLALLAALAAHIIAVFFYW